MKKIFFTLILLTSCLLIHPQTADSVNISTNSDITRNNDSISADSDAEIEIFLDEFPEFPGGSKALTNYLKENITYPKSARQDNIQGKVELTFIIEGDGRVSNVNVVQGIGGGCDEEAMRVVQSMPNWKPGVLNGKTVRVQFTLPINFILDKKTKKQKKDKRK
jgi:TonB family protein